MTLVGDLISAVVGREKQDEGDDDTPAAADGVNADTIEVGGRRWPRRAEVRNALVTSETQETDRKWRAEIARLQALVSDATEARNTQLRALGEVSQAANALVRAEIDAELEPLLRVAWERYVASGSSEDAQAVGRALMHARNRAASEYGAPDTALVSTVLKRVAWPHAGYGGEPLMNALWAASSWDGASVALLQRVLSDVLLLSARMSQS
jgi:hypothetical protein